MNLAALLAVLVVFSPQDGGSAAPRDGGTADGGPEGPAGGGEGGDPADGGAESDAEILRHLDEIENLELLQHLELFDDAGKPDRKP